MATSSLKTADRPVTTIVLAGGKSIRLGRDKTQEPVGGEGLLQRVLRAVAPLSAEVILSVSPESAPLPELFGVRRAVDLSPGGGALGGIHTGLVASRTWHNLVVACDMPFLNPYLLRHMIELATGYDLVIPRLDGQTEPLHAVYSRGCIGPIARLLEQGRLRIAGLFPLVRTRYVEQEEVERFDPQRLSTFNVNTEADLERARQIARGTGLKPGHPPGQSA